MQSFLTKKRGLIPFFLSMVKEDLVLTQAHWHIEANKRWEILALYSPFCQINLKPLVQKTLTHF